MRYLLSIAASVALLVAAPAAAIVKIATFTGLIGSGVDTTGQFGTAGTDLTGLTYTTTYRFSLGSGLRQTTPVSDVYAGIFGPSSYVSGRITINGVSIAIAGDQFGAAATSLSGGEYTSNDSSETPSNDADTALANVVASVMATSLALDVAPVAVTLDPGFSGYAYTTYDYATGDMLTDAVFWFAADATYSVTTGPGVPEPAAWALIVAGFGLVGAAARRQRVATT